MSNTNVKKFLDSEGLKHLWGKVIEADNAAISGLQISKEQNFEIKDKTIKDAIVLKDANGNVISYFDSSDFVADGMLQDVKLDENNNLVFYFNTDSGEYREAEEGETATHVWSPIQPITVDLSKYIDVYTAGDGISISIDSDNNKKIEVSNVGDEKVQVGEITVAGGPLAGVLNEKGITKINAGNLQDVLLSLFCKEEWGEIPRPNTPSYKVKLNNAPSITAKTKNASSIYTSVSNGSYVEVGAPIQMAKVNAVGVTVYNEVQPQVSTFEYGYWEFDEGQAGTTEDDKWVVNSNKSISTQWTIGQVPATTKTEVDGEEKEVAVANSTYKLSASITNFSGTAPSESENYSYDKVSLAQSDFVANVGSNKYEVTEVVPNYTGSYPGIESKYMASNLPETSGRQEDKKSVEMPAASGIVKNVKDNTDKNNNIVENSKLKSTFTVTGAYPILFNGVRYDDADANGAEINTTAVTASQELIKCNSLSKQFGSTTVMYIKFPKQEAGKITWRIGIPTYYETTVANDTITAYKFDGLGSKKYDKEVNFTKLKDTSGNPIKGVAACGDPTQITETHKLAGSVEYEYVIYEYTGTDGENGVKLTINLKK